MRLNLLKKVSESRQQVLLNTLDEEISKYFNFSPPSNISSGNLPVVDDVFQLQIIEEDIAKFQFDNKITYLFDCIYNKS